MINGSFEWVKDIKEAVGVLNAELKVISDEVIFYSEGRDGDKNKKLQELYAGNLKKNIASLEKIIQRHITLPESIDVSPFLWMYLDEAVSQGVFPAPEFGKNATMEVFDYERPPFKIYYLPNENKLIWVRLIGKKGSKWPKRPEKPDLNDVREAKYQDWCKEGSLIVLQMIRNLPEDLQKKINVFFGKNK